MENCLYNPQQRLQDTVVVLTNRITSLENKINDLPITLKNIPIFLQNFTVTVNSSSSSVQYATVSANPSNSVGNRVWNFYLSLLLPASNETNYTIEYDFLNINTTYDITFEDAVSGTIVYQNQVSDASSITYQVIGKILIFNVVLPNAPTTQTTLQLNLVLNDRSSPQPPPPAPLIIPGITTRTDSSGNIWKVNIGGENYDKICPLNYNSTFTVDVRYNNNIYNPSASSMIFCFKDNNYYAPLYQPNFNFPESPSSYLYIETTYNTQNTTPSLTYSLKKSNLPPVQLGNPSSLTDSSQNTWDISLNGLPYFDDTSPTNFNQNYIISSSNPPQSETTGIPVNFNKNYLPIDNVYFPSFTTFPNPTIYIEQIYDSTANFVSFSLSFSNS